MACHYQDIPEDIKPLNIGSDSHANHSGSPTPVKVEHGPFPSDAKSFQPALIKIEDDDHLPVFDIKYIKEEQFTTGEEGTSSSNNMEVNPTRDDVAGSSSPYHLISKVDLGLVKVEEDEDTFSESNDGEDSESGEQYSAHKSRRVEHGEKFEKTFHCIKCQKEFSRKRDLDGHNVARHNNDGEIMNSVTNTISRCKYCKYITIYAKTLAQHMRTHGKKLENTFDCIKCDKEFLRKDRLDSHIVSRHSNDGEMMNSVTSRIHRCKRCKYLTIRPFKLVQHMRTHEEKLEKIFDCVKCKKGFSNKRDLDSHIVTLHNNNDEAMNSVTSKIRHCKHCKYITVYAKNLVRHMRTHGEKLGKTFECIKCETEFSNKRDLNRHIVAQHSNDGEMMNSVTSKLHRCKHCSYITVRAYRLTQHMRTHAKKSIKCKKGFSNKRDLR